MDLTIENIILISSFLLFISVVIGKTSHKFGVPTLILFLGVGMLAGSEGIGGIHFDDPQAAQFIGIIALNFILFSGGLETQWTTIKSILWEGVALSTLGVLLTASTLGFFVWAVTDFTIYEGLLLGSIVSSTDAAAVFSILRSKSLALKSNIRSTLELESGSNDPMAYVLTIVFLGLIVNESKGIAEMVPLFLTQMLVGGIAGFVFGKASKFIINKIELDFEGLYSVLAIALMYITFSTTEFFGGNGFLAVYLCAVYLGNQEIIHKKSLLKMFDGLAWLMQIVLFLTLGLLVYPSHIIPVVGVGMLIALFLILIARPVGVFISLMFFKMHLRRKLFISWVGLRGAVPIVFATYPLLAGIEKASMIFNIVFFISVTSVLIQGTTLTVLAKLLHVALPLKVKPKNPVDELLAEDNKTAMAEIKIPENSFPVQKKILELKFPRTAIIAMIKRKDTYITPNGSTIIKAGDVLIILTSKQDEINNVYKILRIDEADNPML